MTAAAVSALTGSAHFDLTSTRATSCMAMQRCLLPLRAHASYGSSSSGARTALPHHQTGRLHHLIMRSPTSSCDRPPHHTHLPMLCCQQLAAQQATPRLQQATLRLTTQQGVTLAKHYLPQDPLVSHAADSGRPYLEHLPSFSRYHRQLTHTSLQCPKQSTHTCPPQPPDLLRQARPYTVL